MANIRKLRDSLQGMNPNMNQDQESLSSTLGGEMGAGEEVVEDTGGDEASPSMTPPSETGMTASTLAVRERTPMTKRIMSVIQDVQKMKFGTGLTPTERAAGLKKQMESIQADSSAYQQAELNRKDANGISIMDQISGAKRKLEDLESERHGTLQANQWGQIAEQLGNAITQTMAGMYGLKHNVNLSGLTFNRANWEERLKVLLGDVNEQMDRAVKEQVQGQQLAQQVGETAYKTAEGRKQALLASDSKESIAEGKARSDMQSALIGGVEKDAEMASREREGGLNRAAELEKAKTVQGMVDDRADAKELERVNAERLNLGQAPLSSLPGRTSAAPQPTQPTQPTQPMQAAQEGTAQGPQTPQAPLQQQIQQSGPAGPADVNKVSALATTAVTSAPPELAGKMLLSDLQKVPKTPAELKKYLEKLGDLKADYRSHGGDEAANDSIRRLRLLIVDLYKPENANVSGAYGDRAVAGFGKLTPGGIGEGLITLSESARPKLIDIKQRLLADSLKGMKAVFGARITDTDLKTFISTVWENRLYARQNAEKIEVLIGQIEATRNGLTNDPEGNAAFDKESRELVDGMVSQGRMGKPASPKSSDYREKKVEKNDYKKDSFVDRLRGK